MKDRGVSAAGQQKRRLLIVFALTTAYLVVEVVAGLLTKSLALLADAGHMLADVGGLALALFAIRFAERPATPNKTYGYYRAEILAALVNAVVLIVISFSILYEAYRRFQNPPEILSLPMFLVALVGLGVNLVGLKLLYAASGKSLNIKGAYLEVFSDALTSIGVILAGLIMLLTNWYLIDPLISTAIGLFILPRTWSLLNQSVHVLMEGCPPGINLENVITAMKAVEGVKGVHDLHVWTITSGFEALSGHVVVENLAEGQVVLRHLQQILEEKFGVKHVTIQLEEQRLTGEEGRF